MGVNFIKFIHLNIADRVASHHQIIYGGISLKVRLMTLADIDGVPGSQSAFDICVLVVCQFEIYQPPEHLG